MSYSTFWCLLYQKQDRPQKHLRRWGTGGSGKECRFANSSFNFAPNLVDWQTHFRLCKTKKLLNLGALSQSWPSNVACAHFLQDLFGVCSQKYSQEHIPLCRSSTFRECRATYKGQGSVLTFTFPPCLSSCSNSWGWCWFFLPEGLCSFLKFTSLSTFTQRQVKQLHRICLCSQGTSYLLCLQKVQNEISHYYSEMTIA